MRASLEISIEGYFRPADSVESDSDPNDLRTRPGRVQNFISVIENGGVANLPLMVG